MASDPESERRNPAMPAPSVLIVDDNPDIRDSLSDMLIHEGYAVESVGYGAEAIQHITQKRYGVAILDMQLPDLDGLSVLKVIAELDPNLPIVVITAHGTIENRSGSLTRGAFAYLTKPYDSGEVKAILRRAVSIKGLEARAEHVEQALQASEARFRTLVESATDAIVLTDHGGHNISWNQAAERLFGYSKQDALGRPVTILIPARDRPSYEAALARSQRTGQSPLLGKTLEFTGLTKSGREVPLELSLATWTTKDGTYYSGIIRDISERKRAEDALRRLSRHNQLLLDSASDSIYGLDREGRTTFVNPAAARMLGWEIADLLGRPMHDLVHHAHGDGCSYPPEACPIYAALQDGAVHQVHNEVFWRKDGTSFPVEYVSTPIHEQGALVGAVVVFKDISEWKRAERLQQTQLAVSHVLAAAETLEDAAPHILQAVCDTAGWELGVLWLVDHGARALRCETIWQKPDAGLDEFTAISRATALPPGVGLPGRVWSAGDAAWILDVVDDPNFPRAQAAARVGLHAAFAFPVRVGGHIHRVIEFFSRAVREPDGTLLKMMADIGMKIGQFVERKQAAQALVRAYEETEKILASLPGAILIVDSREEIVYANALAAQYFGGHDHATLVRRRLHDALKLPPPARERLERELAAVRAGTPRAPDPEFEADKRVYRYRLFPLMLRAGEPPQTGTIIWDVTEERQIQDHLLQTEKLASLGTMVSGMAHEINNPAQAILGMAELLQEERELEKVREYASDIIAYAKHVSGVARDFVGYTRVTSRDGACEVDLRDRLAEAVKMVRRGPHFGYVEVVTAFDPVPPLRARKAEIDQLFINLIHNAVQAMNGSGRLTLSAAVEQQQVVVRIDDTGCGIPKAVLHKIFDPFFTTKEPGKGTGLGLSIVYRIVTRYGGTLGVESEEGKGTRFTIRFPLHDG
jgi:PAS domain S-box-containing protein